MKKRIYSTSLQMHLGAGEGVNKTCKRTAANSRSPTFCAVLNGYNRPIMSACHVEYSVRPPSGRLNDRCKTSGGCGTRCLVKGLSHGKTKRRQSQFQPPIEKTNNNGNQCILYLGGNVPNIGVDFQILIHCPSYARHIACRHENNNTRLKR